METSLHVGCPPIGWVTPMPSEPISFCSHNKSHFELPPTGLYNFVDGYAPKALYESSIAENLMNTMRRKGIIAIAMTSFSLPSGTAVATLCPGENIEPDGICIVTPTAGGCNGGTCISPYFTNAGAHSIYTINNPPEHSGPCGGAFSTTFNIPVIKHTAQTPNGCLQSGFPEACSYFPLPSSYSCNTTGCAEWCSLGLGMISDTFILFLN
jgi:hypothetical protein